MRFSKQNRFFSYSFCLALAVVGQKWDFSIADAEHGSEKAIDQRRFESEYSTLESHDFVSFTGKGRMLQDCGGSNEDCCVDSLGSNFCNDEHYHKCVDNKCVSCGDEDQPCCEADGLVTCDSEGLVCSSDTDTCLECGWIDQPCCLVDENVLGCRDKKKSACDTTDGKCKSCGGDTEICCEGDNPCDAHYAYCDPDTNTCVSCGSKDKPCCPGGVSCNDDYRLRCVDVDGTDTCKECGGNNEPCRVGNGYPQCDSAFLFCSAEEDTCQYCGNKDQTCCPDANGNNEPGFGTCKDSVKRVCVDGVNGPVCTDCGLHGQPCCREDTCDSLFIKCNSNTGYCQSCGSKNAPCCDGERCDNQGYRACDVSHSSGVPTCVNCGGNGEIPCVGIGISPCDSEYSIVVNGKCESCGKENEPCCQSDNSCRDHSDRACVAGICKECGASGEPCCQGLGGPYCNEGVTCSNDSCVVLS